LAPSETDSGFKGRDRDIYTKFELIIVFMITYLNAILNNLYIVYIKDTCKKCKLFQQITIDFNLPHLLLLNLLQVRLNQLTESDK